MTRQMYVMRDGVLVEIEKAGPKESVHNVHDDIMDPLVHPVTRQTIDSKSKWRRINKYKGLEEVGNEFLSSAKRELPDRITDDLIIDRIHRAEAKVNDRSFMRHFEEQNKERLARREELLYGNRR